MPDALSAESEQVSQKLRQVVIAILRERRFRKRQYGPRADLSVSTWLLLLEAEMDEAKRAWHKGGEAAALAQIVQVAALAVACLENHVLVDR